MPDPTKKRALVDTNRLKRDIDADARKATTARLEAQLLRSLANGRESLRGVSEAIHDEPNAIRNAEARDVNLRGEAAAKIAMRKALVSQEAREDTLNDERRKLKGKRK